MNTLEQMESNINIDEIGSNDVVFKAVMLTRPSCLKAIMETLLEQKIDEIKILNSELPKKQFLEKGKRLDVYLESSDEYIDVEVSTSYNEMTKSRNLSYICHVYSNAVKQGEDYSNYKKASIYNLIWGEKGKYLHTTGRLTDEYGNIISDMLNYHTIHMDNYMEKYYNNDIEFILENKYLIMLGLKLEELDKLIELTKGDEIVEEYKEALKSVLNDYEIAPYIDIEKDREMMLKGSIKEATQKGIEQGIKEGVKQNNLEIAKKMLEENITLDVISKITGLSIEILNNLKD